MNEMACTHYSLQALVVDFTAHVSQQMIHAFECTNQQNAVIP